MISFRAGRSVESNNHLNRIEYKPQEPIRVGGDIYTSIVWIKRPPWDMWNKLASQSVGYRSS